MTTADKVRELLKGASLPWLKEADVTPLASSEAPLLLESGASPLPVYHASEILAAHASAMGA